MLVLTRSEVLDVRLLVTVAADHDFGSWARGLAVEVDVAGGVVGLDDDSAVNCDGLHTIARTTPTSHVGAVNDATMSRV